MAETRLMDGETLDFLDRPTIGGGDAPDEGSRTFGAPTAADGRRTSERRLSKACPGVFLQVHTDLESLESEWRRFEAAADCTAFQCYDWLSKWQRHIGLPRSVQPAIGVGRDPQGRLLFVFPLAVERRGFVRRLTWLGSDLCDYNGPLLAPEAADHFRTGRFRLLWSEILALLRADPRLRFDLIDLPKMPETIGGQANPFLSLKVALHSSGAHIASISGSWDDLYAARRSSATRKRERRQFRRLAEFGPVQFVEPRELQDVERTLQTLFHQKADSFSRMGVENFLARPGCREFFRDLATASSAAAFTHVSRLDIGSTMAGTSFGLEHRGRYYLLLSSYQDGELSRYGPGRAHLQELIRRAIRRGLAQFDFTVGDEPYKRDWADITLPLYDHFAATTLLGWPVVAGTALFQRAKRAIKQNPLLWRIFNEGRRRWGTTGRLERSATSEGED